jgi:DNA-directed RNA polymerase II subunit RPB11
MNAPDRMQVTFLSADEQKVQIVKDAKLLNAATFYFTKQDHTLGNMLRMSLLRDKDVRFAGYRMPHPLTPVCEVKVQTNGDSDALSAVISALDSLDTELQTLENRFKNAFAAGLGDAHDVDAHDIMRLA